MLYYIGSFFVGACCASYLTFYLLADERTLARLYPASLGLKISHDIRVLSAIQSNEVDHAKSLLRQDIESNVNSLLGLEKANHLDEHSRNAMLAGQGALRSFGPQSQKKKAIEGATEPAPGPATPRNK
jgi:hypothetical protein